MGGEGKLAVLGGCKEVLLEMRALVFGRGGSISGPWGLSGGITGDEGFSVWEGRVK